jgi:hypothetical protein
VKRYFTYQRARVIIPVTVEAENIEEARKLFAEGKAKVHSYVAAEAELEPFKDEYGIKQIGSIKEEFGR